MMMVAFGIFALQNLFADGPFSSVDSFETKKVNWYNLDPVNDSVQGASIDRAYFEILPGMVPVKKIVVAVIDGGVDIDHKDLKGKIWVNANEIPGNGIDDDQNGYVDDIHGWNFLGNASGENIRFENYEYVRIVKKYDSIFSAVRSINELPPSEWDNYKNYLASKEKYNTELQKYETEKSYIDFFEKAYYKATGTLKNYLGKDTILPVDLDRITSTEDSVKLAKDFMSYVFDNHITLKELNDFKQYNSDFLDKKLNMNMNFRAVISDDPTDIKDTGYGNNDIIGPSPEHGTFVAGIIAANRNNGEGIDGIAENVEIMVLRAVPDGDEYDKDIALAIRYAVDNGANIINMSFGKSFSPQKKFVDEALKHAVKNNILLIHSAGNDANNIDEKTQYPTRIYIDGSEAPNYITVGATTDILNEHFVAAFSNFGQKNVDLFAPGVDIVSLYPNNKYNSASGTSFSGPVVTGIAALIWSYFPQLSASEIKDIILQSVTKPGKLQVYYPAEKGKQTRKVKFSKLSRTGGIVNAYNAILLAGKVVAQKQQN
jgi:subtilisin family serine protease